MSELDIRTKNVLNALESLLTKSSTHLPAKTHEEMVQIFIKHTTRVLDNYKKFKRGEINVGMYKADLIKLAEIVLIAYSKLPG